MFRELADYEPSAQYEYNFLTHKVHSGHKYKILLMLPLPALLALAPRNLAAASKPFNAAAFSAAGLPLGRGGPRTADGVLTEC